jgi:hypothetical protein
MSICGYNEGTTTLGIPKKYLNSSIDSLFIKIIFETSITTKKAATGTINKSGRIIALNLRTPEVISRYSFFAIVNQEGMLPPKHY